jgi:hypothetical protein
MKKFVEVKFNNFFGSQAKSKCQLKLWLTTGKYSLDVIDVLGQAVAANTWHFVGYPLPHHGD